MPKKEKEYKRLPGRGLRRTGGVVAVSATRSSLWLGRDHLLSMDAMWFVEDYKRFYYRDIQTFLIRKTARGKAINLVFGIFATSTLLPAVLGGAFWGWGPDGWYVCGGIALFFLLFVGINALMGPTCICYLQTAVQREELPSIRRLRAARKIVNRLRPLIEAAQGTLSPEEMRIQSAQVFQNIPASVPLVAKPVKHEHGRFHEILFYLLLFDGALVGLDIFYDHVALTLLRTVIGMGIFGMLIMALIRQHRSDMISFVKGLTWTAVGYAGIRLLVGYIPSVTFTVQHPGVTENYQWEMIKATSKMSALESPWIMGYQCFELVCSLLLGCLGLGVLYWFRRDYGTVAPDSRPSTEMTPSGT